MKAIAIANISAIGTSKKGAFIKSDNITGNIYNRYHKDDLPSYSQYDSVYLISSYF